MNGPVNNIVDEKFYKRSLTILDLVNKGKNTRLAIFANKRLQFSTRPEIDYTIKKLVSHGVLTKQGEFYCTTKRHTVWSLRNLYNGAFKSVTCDLCNLSKRKYKIRPSVYHDNYDRPWKHNTCPSCVMEENATMTDRKCRTCPDMLSVSRYFRCINCQPMLPTDMHSVEIQLPRLM